MFESSMEKLPGASRVRTLKQLLLPQSCLVPIEEGVILLEYS